MSKRVINGIEFTGQGTPTSKAAADRAAKGFRKRGYSLVRVVKLSKHAYMVYTCK